MLEIRLAELALKILTRRYFGGVSQRDSQNPISVCTPTFHVPPAAVADLSYFFKSIQRYSTDRVSCCAAISASACVPNASINVNGSLR
ncbi:hypothetical protein D5G53_18555 [Salmonella enterica subsp. enterica serovar Mbandaka]|nr:hypothetical protein D5G53_18555 [Salmonella enterica subsp. enterica serovar Mbandaka]